MFEKFTAFDATLMRGKIHSQYFFTKTFFYINRISMCLCIVMQNKLQEDILRFILPAIMQFS